MKRLLLLSILSFFLHTASWAYDFAVPNNDGKTIYYNILSSEELTCIVTYIYSGTSFNSVAYNGDVVIPSTVTYYGKTYSVVEIGSDAFNYCTSLTSVTIPSSVTTIGFEAFRHAGLNQINIPNSVTEIRRGAFTYSGLTEITIPNSVTTIESSVFCGCYALTEVTIPESITTIGDNAFDGCDVLTEVTIGENVTSIGSYAFRDCKSLWKVNFNATACKSASSLTFSSCNKLSTVNIGNNVTKIPDNILSYRSSLEKLTIGSSVTSIGEGAFRSCSALKLIISLNPEPPTCGDEAFSYVPTSTCVLNVPEEAKEAYSVAEQWKDFLNIKTELVDGNIEESVMKLYDYGLDCQTDNISTDESFYIGFKVLNTSSSTAYSGGYRFGLCNKDGIVKEWISSVYETSSSHDEPIQPRWWFSIYSWLCKVTSKIEVGDRIRLYYKDDYSELWKLLTPYSDEVVWEIVLDDYTGVMDIYSNGNAEVVGFYTTDGKQVPTLQRGVNIIRYSDGTAKKVLVK